MNTNVIYPGTFDPITNGHVDIIKRASKMFHKVTVAVAESPRKNTLFTLDERIDMVQEVFKGHSNIVVKGFSGLLVEFAKAENANILIRGLRTTIDFEYELGLSTMYQKLMPEIESLFLPPNEKYAFLSSTIVREVALHGGDVADFVHPYVAKQLQNK
ncbi:phosphopantetheine adenylyltransferase [Vibrio sinaloensis DSM 21326]|uniref:Phosphopantetheine adenylyltransferase n=1 Tax=Vibrio sinaloensis DSM 21326 TaxID=945550 RepID=E8M555_PHOS4|nr:pantetheine-phosphate adenylyltransferase [Vibrio sinaloensis]EGA70906.1 phosphopantetheine adenylyltransferase [Vibrio sinaloensis DSM 21326]